MSSSGWQNNKLRDLCTKIGSGATPRGGKESYLDEGSFALIRSQNVLDFFFSYDGLAHIDEDQANQLSTVELRERDVLLNITGDSVARVCQVPSALLPARVNQHVSIIRPNISKLIPEYLKYFLLNPRFKNYMLGLASVGGTRNALTKGMIEDFEIDLPPLPTQRRIAAILSALDDKIELNRQTNATLEAIAQAIFKEWFVEFRFPGATGEMQESELGMIPQGWQVSKLGEIYKTTSGGTPSRSNPEFYEDGTIYWVKSKELNNSFITETEEKITEDALRKSSAKLLPAYSVLIAMYGATVGESGIISMEAACNQAICAFLPNDESPFTFIYHFLKNNKDEIISRAVGSAQQNISQDLLKQIDTVLPPKVLLSQFHKAVNPAFQAIESNIKQIATLAQIRDSLLPKLMNGEIEV